MSQVNTNEFKQGLKIVLDKTPCEIIEHEFHKPGKGQAVMRIKYRDLLTNRVLEKTFKTGESVEKAEIVSKEMQFLYQQDNKVILMDTTNYEQFECDQSKIEKQVVWMKEGANYEIIFWEDALITVEIDNFVDISVKETDPGLKGDTAQGGTKPATLSSGAVVKVPLFVNIGDVLRVDTRTGEYQNRVNK